MTHLPIFHHYRLRLVAAAAADSAGVSMTVRHHITLIKDTRRVAQDQLAIQIYHMRIQKSNQPDRFTQTQHIMSEERRVVTIITHQI